MEVLKIQDAQGRTMHISDFMLNEAKHFGWTSGIADKSMAEALEKARNDVDPETGLPGWNESLGRCAESAAIIGFCNGGPAYNSMLNYVNLDDPGAIRAALRELRVRVGSIHRELGDVLVWLSQIDPF